MDRRHSARVDVQLPVEVWGLDAHGQAFMDPAIVTNMSTAGIILQGLRRKIRAGEILDVRMGNDRRSIASCGWAALVAGGPANWACNE